MRTEPTEKQLRQAFHEARCKGDLNAAMQNRAMAIALTNTATTIAERAKSPSPAVRVVLDFKKRCAGDDD